MATTIIEGKLDMPLEQAVDTTRRRAAENGYALAEGESGPTELVFKKGMSWFSWGSRLAVHFAAASETSTRLTVTTRENLAIVDWGRGKRATQKLLDAVGAIY